MIFLQITCSMQEGSATNKPGVYKAIDEWKIFMFSEEKNLNHPLKHIWIVSMFFRRDRTHRNDW